MSTVPPSRTSTPTLVSKSVRHIRPNLSNVRRQSGIPNAEAQSSSIIATTTPMRQSPNTNAIESTNISTNVSLSSAVITTLPPKTAPVQTGNQNSNSNNTSAQMPTLSITDPSAVSAGALTVVSHPRLQPLPGIILVDRNLNSTIPADLKNDVNFKESQPSLADFITFKVTTGTPLSSAISRKDLNIRRKNSRIAPTKNVDGSGWREENLSTTAEGTPGVVAPRVKMVDGKIVIDESSLIVTADSSRRRLPSEFEVVNESTNFVSSWSYSNRKAPDRWSDEETEKFYHALRQYGSDFSIIQNLFPNRSRRQVKIKFKKEEREHPEQLESALANRLPIDLGHFRLVTGFACEEDTSRNDSLESAIIVNNTEQIS